MRRRVEERQRCYDTEEGRELNDGARKVVIEMITGREC